MPLHAQIECLDTAQGEKAVERSGNRTYGVMQESQLFAQAGVTLVSTDDGDAANDIGVTVDVLGCRVHNDVETEFQWSLCPRRRKGVVRHRDDAVLAAKGGERFQVGELEQGVGRRFDHDHAGFRPYRRGDRLKVGQVDIAEGEPGAAHTYAVHEAEGSAIEIVAGDHMGARIDQLEDGGDGRHARREGKSLGTAFQIGDAAFESPARGVVRTTVVQALVHARAGVNVGRIGKNRGDYGAGAGIRRLAGMDGTGRETGALLEWCGVSHAIPWRK